MREFEGLVFKVNLTINLEEKDSKHEIESRNKEGQTTITLPYFGKVGNKYISHIYITLLHKIFFYHLFYIFFDLNTVILYVFSDINTIHIFLKNI